MSENKSGNVLSNGVGVTSLLTIVFVVLKLTKVISWSWWWVLSPLWIDIVGGVVVISALIIIEVIRERKWR